MELTNGNHWWNVASKDTQSEVEWDDESFIELGL